MRLIKGLPSQPRYPQGCVLTIGNFDGVHLGHRAVIEKLAAVGEAMQLPVVVLLFEPQPLEFFLQDKAPPRLTRFREKLCRLAKLPIADVVVVRFNKPFADLTAGIFVQKVLIESLNVKHLVIGDDFKFGKNRQGDFALLKAKGQECGFAVQDTGSFLMDGQRVSSTLIRNALVAGDLDSAKAMLGYGYSVCGRVVHGNKRGRAIGYPTANIQLARRNPAINGVFAVTVTNQPEGILNGVANVGVRPTVGGDKVVLEIHLFEFNRDIYGQQLEVEFNYKIRAERQFQSMEELKAQIERDAAEAKQFFALRR